MKPEVLEAFREIASDPSAWRFKAQVLRDAAESLWDSYKSLFAQAPAPESKDEQLTVINKWLERMQTAQLLYGLVVESGCKARIVEQDAANIKFREKRNGEGEVIDITITKIGVDLGSDGHDLVKLATAAGMLDQYNELLYPVESDFTATRELLAYLTDCVRWSSRYPTPKRLSERYFPGAPIPSRILGHYMRDFLDPFLDVLLGKDEKAT